MFRFRTQILVIVVSLFVFQGTVYGFYNNVKNPEGQSAVLSIVGSKTWISGIVSSDGSVSSDIYLPQNGESVVKISFAGDCTLGTDSSFPYTNSFPYRLEKQGMDYGYFFSGVKQIFMEDDLTLVNLETTLTNAQKKADKKFRFRGDPAYVNILKSGFVEMVNISNNHIYDYLDKGFGDTVKALKDAGIYYSGEGNTAYYRVKGITIASIGYIGWDTSIRNKLCKSIDEARKKADIVIVSFHWGEERELYPNNVQTELGRLSIDRGADIVIGHHPHVIQGIEKYKDKYIVYSLGNFCFGGNTNPSDKDTFIFQCEFAIKDNKAVGSSGNIIPCSISSVSYVNDYRPTVLSGENGNRVVDRIYSLSSKLKYGIKKQ